MDDESNLGSKPIFSMDDESIWGKPIHSVDDESIKKNGMNQKKKYRELIQQKSADKEKSWGRYPSATVMIPLFNISCLHLHKKIHGIEIQRNTKRENCN